MGTSEYPAVGLDDPILRLRTWARSIPVDVWAVVAITSIAALIRILTINTQSFWADEALTAYEAHLPFGAMLNTVAHTETTPPLFFVVVWFWAKLFGTGELALRSVSMLAGIALVPIAYLSARELVTRWAGVIAAAFMALNPFMIWYSQEARSYMLLAALTGAGFLWFARSLEDPSRRNLTWWAVLSALAVMTHFFAGFAVAPEAVWLLWRWRSRPVLIAAAVPAVTQLAMAPFAFADTGHGTAWIAAMPRAHRVSSFAVEWGLSALYRRATVAQGFAGAAVLVLAVGLLLWLAGDARTRQGAQVGAVVGGFVLLAPLVLGFVGQDYWLSRNEIPAFIPLTTAVTAACVVPGARVLGAALAAALLGVFAYGAIRVQTNPILQRPDWRTVVRALGPATAPRAILSAGGTTADPLKIYLPHVAWAQRKGLRVRLGEIDVVGAINRSALVSPGGHPDEDVSIAQKKAPPQGISLPARSAPPGMRLLERVRVRNWIVARFALIHPQRFSINELTQISPRFFVRRHTPQALLVFMQRR